MTEEAIPSPSLVEAQENLADAQEKIGISNDILIENLLQATNGNVALVKDLMKDVANVSGHAGTLAVAERRVSAEKHKTNDPHDLHPDKMPAKQESQLYGSQGAQPIISAIEKIK